MYMMTRFIESVLSEVLYSVLFFICGPGSSVGIATELRAGRSGVESRWGRDFPPVQTDPGAHPASCTMDTGSFPGVKCGRGVLLTTHSLLVPSGPHRACNGITLPFVFHVQNAAMCSNNYLGGRFFVTILLYISFSMYIKSNFLK